VQLVELLQFIHLRRPENDGFRIGVVISAWDIVLKVEKRKTPEKYYYHSCRDRGRVRTRYYGGGDIGALAADAFAARREQRLKDQERERAEVQRLVDFHHRLRQVDDDLKNAIELLLVAAGFYNDGLWRVRHEFAGSRLGLRRFRKRGIPGAAPAGKQRG
jgi:double-GTPase-like protein